MISIYHTYKLVLCLTLLLATAYGAAEGAATAARAPAPDALYPHAAAAANAAAATAEHPYAAAAPTAEQPGAGEQAHAVAAPPAERPNAAAAATAVDPPAAAAPKAEHPHTAATEAAAAAEAAPAAAAAVRASAAAAPRAAPPPAPAEKQQIDASPDISGAASLAVELAGGACKVLAFDLPVAEDDDDGAALWVTAGVAGGPRGAPGRRGSRREHKCGAADMRWALLRQDDPALGRLPPLMFPVAPLNSSSTDGGSQAWQQQEREEADTSPYYYAPRDACDALAARGRLVPVVGSAPALAASCQKAQFRVYLLNPCGPGSPNATVDVGRQWRVTVQTRAANVGAGGRRRQCLPAWKRRYVFGQTMLVFLAMAFAGGFLLLRVLPSAVSEARRALRARRSGGSVDAGGGERARDGGKAAEGAAEAAASDLGSSADLVVATPAAAKDPTAAAQAAGAVSPRRGPSPTHSKSAAWRRAATAPWRALAAAHIALWEATESVDGRREARWATVLACASTGVLISLLVWQPRLRENLDSTYVGFVLDPNSTVPFNDPGLNRGEGSRGGTRQRACPRRGSRLGSGWCKQLVSHRTHTRVPSNTNTSGQSTCP